MTLLEFPGGSVAKNLPENAEDMGSISGSGRFPGVRRNGHPPRSFYLENSMERGVWQATVRGVPESNRTERTRLSLCVTLLRYLTHGF